MNTRPGCMWTERMDLLLDAECPREERRVLEEHRGQCGTCTRAWQVTRALQAQLQPSAPADVPPELGLRVHAIAHRRGARVLPWAGWVLALSLAVAWIGSAVWPRRPPPVPMVQAAIADYRLHMRAELPSMPLTVLAQATGLALTPLSAPQARLLAAWALPMRGTLAAAMAYRVGTHVVVQYVVRRSLFFRQPKIRQAVRRFGLYRSREGNVSVLAWPGPDNGSLVVGRVPPGVLRALKM
ncbi:MAG TPA: hypothetical protein VFN52_04700 [Acidiferrobacteraceae bacterium]|nr:hypothetical protein [Acidiferrobacteraceae bacterium]